MPVKIKRTKTGRYVVRTPGGVKAKGTTKKKAQKRANLLRAVDHGWKPADQKAGKKKAKK